MRHLEVVVAFTLGCIMLLGQVSASSHHRMILQLDPVSPAPTPDQGRVESPVITTPVPEPSQGVESPKDNTPVPEPSQGVESPKDNTPVPEPSQGVESPKDNTPVPEQSQGVESPKDNNTPVPEPSQGVESPKDNTPVPEPSQGVESPKDNTPVPEPSQVVESPNTVPTPAPSSTTPPSARPFGLRVGFYKGLCPNKNVDVEATLTAKVQQEFRNDPTILPALLRMQFHDCFVHGCDASILIAGPTSERTAGPNLSVRGYELIDALKEAAEAVCPGVVSCADIIAIATKEVIKLGGGPGYAVQTGRRDGLIARAQDVILPSPFASVSQSVAAFAAKNFTPREMVILLGCHTVGISHCAFFEGRLYESNSQFDPNMDSDLREQLKPVCPENMGSNNFTFLDQNPPSSNIVDNSFFDQIVKQRGILAIDQALARDPQTKDFVEQFARNPNLFRTGLANAMVKMQALDVLTGNQGQIRNVCSRVN